MKLGRVLILAEKPDQGMTLASVFQHKKNQGYIEIFPNELFPEGAYVSWAIGHLCQLVPPENYNPQWKKWTLESLPLLPSQFKYEVTKDKSRQFQIIKRLLARPEVSEVIHAGDAGREGELIIRNILRMAGSKKPMKRLWISSLTPKAIRAGFQSLKNEAETRNLFYEAYTRACADWLVGMNASRLYSLLLQKQGFNDVFSAGRVQTPTLALIVKREEEIENFVSEPFWEVYATFHINGKKYTGKWVKDGNSRIDSRETAEKIAVFCEKKPAAVGSVQAEKKEYQPPYLYNLSALQAEANRRYKFPPQKTLDVLQRLYQKGFISYPRSDSRHVTEGEAEGFPEILNKLSLQEGYGQFFPLPHPTIKNNKRFVNSKKVTDHYAIIPTEQVPQINRLSSDEKKLYEMIAKSLIAAHYGKAVMEYTTVITIVDGRAVFESKGKVQLEEGWRKVIPPFEKDRDEELPVLKQGEEGETIKTEVKESKTQPPKRYTEGQLITLMKSAGKHLEDKELEKVLMKTEGLGTEATRAGIISMLKERKYIEIRKNLVYATAKGKILIKAVGDTLLASPEMTAKWEQRLKEISEGKASPKNFIEQTNKMITHLISTAVSKEAEWEFSGEDKLNFEPAGQIKKKKPVKLGVCKKCGGAVIDKGTFYGCVNYQKTNCDFTISKTIKGKKITQKQIKKLLTEGNTELIEGFRGKNKEFAARLIWDEQEQRIKFEF